MESRSFLCLYDAARAVNPYHLIERMEYQECNCAVRRIVPRISRALADIQKLIESIPVISDAQKKYYTAVLRSRYENVLFPVYQLLGE